MPVVPARTIVVSGGNCSQRGTMYAAFGLLRSLGFKFLAPDETVTPTAAAAVAVAAASGIGAHVVPRMIWPPRHLWDTHREWFWPRDNPSTYGQVRVDWRR